MKLKIHPELTEYSVDKLTIIEQPEVKRFMLKLEKGKIMIHFLQRFLI
jgi:hypothetical protein